jgi:hypothetical protein
MKYWNPDPPISAGIYHAYAKGFHKQTRVHKLFIVVNGGCRKACDQLYNLCCDVSQNMTGKDVCESGEMWWVKNACGRARGRIAKMIADKFGLVVKTSLDTFAFKTAQKVEIAVPTTETLYNSIEYLPNSNEIALYNNCCNPLKSRNGILCNMHPSEGVWIFRGPLHTKSSFLEYGSAWGVSNRQIGFPTNVVRFHKVSQPY